MQVNVPHRRHPCRILDNILLYCSRVYYCLTHMLQFRRMDLLKLQFDTKTNEWQTNGLLDMSTIRVNTVLDFCSMMEGKFGV